MDAIERLQADPRAPSVLAFLDPSAAGAFALAMAHQTIRDSERLTKLSEGSCDLDDVDGIIKRIVAVSVMALSGEEAPQGKTHSKLVARDIR